MTPARPLPGPQAHVHAPGERWCPGCRRVHTFASWQALPLDGHVRALPSPDGRRLGLERRRCRCGTVAAVVVDLRGRP